MVYRRRTYRGRRPTNKRFRGVRRSFRSKYTIQKAIDKNVEFKHHEVHLDPIFGQAWTSDAQVYPLNLIPQGSDDQQMIGNKVILRGITIRGEGNTVTSGPATTNRWCLVWDKVPSSVTPNLNSIFEPDSTGACLHNGINRLYRHRFRLLKEYYFTLGSSVDDEKRHMFRYYRKLFKPSIVRHIDDTTIRTGALYLVFMGSSTVNAASGYVNVDIKYTDS